MEIEIIALRRKQRIRYLLGIASISLVTLVLTIYLVSSLTQDSQPKRQGEVKQAPHEEESLLLCHTSDSDEQIVAAVQEKALEEVESVMTVISTQYSECDISIVRNLRVDSRFESLWQKTYLLVNNSSEGQLSFTGDELKKAISDQSYQGRELIWSNKTDNFIKSNFQSVSGQQYATDEDVVAAVIDGNITAIIPFEAYVEGLSYGVIDQNTPLGTQYDSSSYPLLDRYWIYIDQKLDFTGSEFTEAAVKASGEINFDSSQLTEIVVTGESTLALIGSGEEKLKLSSDIVAILQNADLAITHEDASYYNKCPYFGGTSFICGKPESLEMYSDIGIDAVAVAGNHIMDYGRDGYLDYLQNLDQMGFIYFGGGANATQAITPRFVESNGIKIALLQFNMTWPTSYYATNKLAGGASADFMPGDALNLTRSLEKAKENGSHVIIVMFHWSNSHSQSINSQQQLYARIAIDGGATVVVGVNPEYIQDREIYKDKSIYYSLGNFLKNGSVEKDEHGAIVRLMFYKDRYIASEKLLMEMGEKNSVYLSEKE